MNVSVPAALRGQMLTALSLQDSWLGKVEKKKRTMTRSNPQQLPRLFVSISGDIFRQMTSLFLAQQEPILWIHYLDISAAAGVAAEIRLPSNFLNVFLCLMLRRNK